MSTWHDFEKVGYLLRELEETVRELQDIYADLGETESAATEARIVGFFNSMAKTVSEREKEAERNAAAFTIELPKLRAAREAQILKRDLLLLKIELIQKTNKSL